MLRLTSVVVLVSCSLPTGFHGDPHIKLREHRESPSDLELTGLAKGPLFVSRAAIESLPQVKATLRRDEDFVEVPEGGVEVNGVDLGDLRRAVGAKPDAMILAICSDGYTAPFTAEYVREHHPIFVTTVDGLNSMDWAKKSHAVDLGPYFVTYRSFKPSFRVLTHDDHRQVPVQVLALKFTTAEQAFKAILPKGRYAADSPVMQGYRIAQQNCFRCHNAGGDGGTKSKKSWQMLGDIAKMRPEHFQAWVHDPQSFDAKSMMIPNPKYDRATLTALTRYFETFSVEGD